jgi:alkanesulfonate monooxygenase SsuD/methylene tetrahydromethanopterin reductase-like flavin-dependent oxidoreductase (luciferase family)
LKVQFGVSLGSSVGLLGGGDTHKFMELARMADGYGATAIGTYDSAFLGGDAYVRATLIALAAPRAAVGLRPSNPLTREPQVMASFLASLDRLTGGRAFLDIASGDSAVFNIGYPAASRARIEDYVACVRGLLARGEATYQGRVQRVRWSAEAVRPRVPISICAEGPKMLHLGGRIGDGVIAGTGLLPEVISDTIARVHAGAREAGRDPGEVDVWFTARSSLHEDRETAVENVKASVSSILNHAMRFGLDGKSRARRPAGQDPGLRGRLRAVRPRAARRAKPAAHGRPRPRRLRGRALGAGGSATRLDHADRGAGRAGSDEALGRRQRRRPRRPDTVLADDGRAGDVAVRGITSC